MRKGLDMNEVLSLAKTMEVKFSVSGPAIGGAKSGINFDPSDPRKKGVLQRWYKAVSPLLKSYYYSARRKGKGPVNEGTMDNTIQRIINSSVKELLDACNDFDNETFPDYLSLEDCGFIDLIRKITVKKITPIKKLSNLPMFDVELDIDYNTALSSVDFEGELAMITDHIKKKYKIFLVFTVMEQNNLHDRQMEGSLKPLIKNVLREEMTELQMYMWKIKRDLEDNYYKVTRKFEDPWLNCIRGYLSKNELLSRWHDCDYTGNIYNQTGIVCWKRSQPHYINFAKKIL
jgi:hypothetical protein